MAADKDTEIAERLDYYAEFAIDETNYYVKVQEDARSDDESLPLFDPKTTFKSTGGVRALERQVIQAVKALARRPDSDVLFDVAPA